MRIVSLLPSATEIVYALGLADQLLGVTDECDVERGRHQVVVRARQPPDLTAAEIDAWVTALAPQGGLYDLDDVAVADLAPDLVLTQDLCRVCAVPAGEVDLALARVGCPSRVVTLEPTSLAGVLATVRTVADAAGEPARGATAVAALQRRLDAVRAAVGDRDPVPTLVLEWLDPPFTSGHWVPDVVAAAGGRPLLGNAGGRSESTSWVTALACNPDVVVLAPCGTAPRRTWDQAHLVPTDLLTRRVVAADLARPGPSLVDAVEALAAFLHPKCGLSARPEIAVPRPVR